MPLIETFGSGSAIGFGRGVGGATFEPFTLTLNASGTGRLGDNISTVNSFWSGYSSPLLTSKGIQTYDGYYACTLAFDARINATANGAAGWRNTNGRSITATFNLSAGTRLVFFAGKATTSGGGQNQGAGGGASMIATHSGSTFTPLVVAAGGSASFNSRLPNLVAPALSVSEGNDAAIQSARNSVVSTSGSVVGKGGIGRPSTAQGGGGGWFTNGLNESGTPQADNTISGQSLSSGAKGGTSSTSEGGFGGGGGDLDNNSYGGGGGGYWGSWESATSSSSSYKWYAINGSPTEGENNYMGPLSYVNPSRVSRTDNGLWGDSNDAAASTGGRVVIEFLNP